MSGVDGGGDKVADGGAALERGGVKPAQGWSGAGEAGQGDGVVWTERCGARPGRRERSRRRGGVAGYAGADLRNVRERKRRRRRPCAYFLFPSIRSDERLGTDVF